jgi:hypothetical protein
VIEEILPSLQKVKRTGPKNWMACCPAHEDRSPSMTLRAEDDGRILVRCFAGCGFEDIVGAVGLGYEPWFPPKPPASDRVPAVRRPYPAGDVLEALSFECIVIAVHAADLATGEEMTELEKARMWLAFERFEQGRRLANG